MQSNDDKELAAQILHMENTIRQYLTKEAILRIGNIKLVYPKKALQIIATLYHLINEGKITSKVDDIYLKTLIKKLTHKQMNFSIRRK